MHSRAAEISQAPCRKTQLLIFNLVKQINTFFIDKILNILGREGGAFTLHFDRYLPRQSKKLGLRI